MSNQLLSALKDMVRCFQPFTSKPIGAPGSSARIEQDDQIAAYRSALAAIAAAESADAPTGAITR